MVVAVAAGPVVVALVAVAIGAGLVGVLVGRDAARRGERRRTLASMSRLGLAAPDPTTVTDDLLAVVERHVRDLRVEVDSTTDARHRLQRALDSLPQAVLIMDKRGSVLERNAASDTLVEARHADALVEAAVAELIDSALAGQAASRTIDLFGPPRRMVVVTTTPLESTAGPAAVAVVEDVTERRRLEAVRTDFVANISHELKTPVGAIGLLAETLEAEHDPEVAARLAGRIQSEALRVGRTIEDLLELSRIESGQRQPFAAVALDDVVLEAVERIRPAAGQAGLTIDASRVPEDLVVPADRRQLISALSNLLDNAVKYSDAGSSIEIVVHQDGDEVVLEVADHGIGIPSRDIERIFERFYRVDQARSRQTGGTGLGLAIVRHVVANHDGTIDVESRLGEGSRFLMRLPAPPPASPAEPARPMPTDIGESEPGRPSLRPDPITQPLPERL